MFFLILLYRESRVDDLNLVNFIVRFGILRLDERFRDRWLERVWVVRVVVGRVFVRSGVGGV